MTDLNPPVITRVHLTDHLRQAGCGSTAQAAELLDVILQAIADALDRGATVALRRFGRFEVIATPERPGRNPKTGEPAVIPAARRIKFRPSKYLLAKEDA